MPVRLILTLLFAWLAPVAAGLSGDAAPPVVAPGSGFVAPVDGPLQVGRRFERPPKRWDAGHRGVDLAAAAGVVRSPADGVVSFVGVVVDRPVLSIDHGRGLVSSFEPVTATVVSGQVVARGQVVGTLSGAHQTPSGARETTLHWGVRLDGEYVDPLTLLGLSDPPVLLPLLG